MAYRVPAEINASTLLKKYLSVSKMNKRSRRDLESESESDFSDVDEFVAAGLLDGGQASDYDDETDGGSVHSAAKSVSKIGAFQPSINNVLGLRQAFASFKQELPWIERLEVVSAEPLSVTNVNDDIKVELAFYGQALAAVQAARGELERLQIPHRRPDDYFAEMLKSDAHMKKVKGKLLQEQARIEASERRKKDRHNREFSKQIQAEKQREAAAQRKSEMDSLKQWRKNRESNNSGSLTEEEVQSMFGSSGKMAGMKFQFGSEGGDSSKAKKSALPQKSNKRQVKDKKYGFGGKKKYAKSNDAKSSASMKGFSVKRMKSSMPKGMSAKMAGGKKGRK